MQRKSTAVFNRLLVLSTMMLGMALSPSLSSPVHAASPIIADHLQTDISSIPIADIQNAKSKLHIAYGHTSHGSQVIDGMTGLIGFMSGHGYPQDLFSFNNGGSNGALDLHDYAMGGDVGYYPAWVNNTRSYLGTPDPSTGRGTGANADINVIIWSWCGEASGLSSQAMIDNYLAPMTQLEADYPGIKFVYMTGHLDGSGESGNLNQRNEQIRNYVRNNNKILFDFADIESYDPEGLVNYMQLNGTDGCYYNSDGAQRNWAIEWQNSHVQNVDWYSCYSAHSEALNANRKAYAAWWLWSEIACDVNADSDQDIDGADAAAMSAAHAAGNSSCLNVLAKNFGN